MRKKPPVFYQQLLHKVSKNLAKRREHGCWKSVSHNPFTDAAQDQEEAADPEICATCTCQLATPSSACGSYTIAIPSRSEPCQPRRLIDKGVVQRRKPPTAAACQLVLKVATWTYRWLLDLRMFPSIVLRPWSSVPGTFAQKHQLGC